MNDLKVVRLKLSGEIKKKSGTYSKGQTSLDKFT